LETQQSPAILDLCLRKTRAGKSRDYRDVIVFEKRRFQNVFPSTLKGKAGVFKFLQFEERFRKPPFSFRISMDGRPNRRNKAAFSNFFGVMWTEDKERRQQKGQKKINIRPQVHIYKLPVVWKPAA